MRVRGAMTMRFGRSRPPMRTGVKSGWRDITNSWRRGSERDDDFADLVARLHEAMGLGDLVEGEGSRDCGAQRPIGEAVADEALQRGEVGVVPRDGGQS